MATNFEKQILKTFRGYASFVTRLAKKLAPNNHIRKSIRSTVEVKGKSRFIIRTRAFGPDARAREFGSGVWARRGPKGKILIKPKKKVLVFPWDVATSPISGKISSDIPRTSDGKVILKEVEHPGVEAANNGIGYIGPAHNEARKVMRSKILKDGANAIRLDMRLSFRNANVR